MAFYITENFNSKISISEKYIKNTVQIFLLNIKKISLLISKGNLLKQN